jgi:hypothetical protein
MNIQSEIDFFVELGVVDKARFVCRLIFEIAEETRAGEGASAPYMRFAHELNQRLVRFCYQILSEDGARPADEVMIRMLLGARADKVAERLVHNSYRRVLTGFDSFDTTVLLGKA